MNIRDLRPASEFAKCYGVKMLAYGPPGEGKTPLINTAPRPVVAMIEPGFASMRTSSVPTWDATTPERCDEFFKWVFGSAEVKNFDTICIDSVSQMAEMYLKWAKTKSRDGRAVYGIMAEKVMEQMDGIFAMKNKHAYLVCKQSFKDGGETTFMRPYFPGQELDVRIPHLFDIVAHIAKANVPGMNTPVTAIRCVGTPNIRARNRFGTLNEFEPPDLSALFNKAMATQ